MLRITIGIAIVTVAASCLATNELAASLVKPQQPRSHQARYFQPREQPVAVLPAGPDPSLLAQLSMDDADTSGSIPVTIAPPFRETTDLDDMARATKCLTAAVYYEARSQSLEGQEAVAQVVLNRVRNRAFPDSVCGTVYEGSSRETGCQFTFTCDGSLSGRIEPTAWDRARQVATAALNGYVYAPVGNATYYHTAAVNPWWAPSLKRITQIGAHIFYQMPGRRGSSLAFSQNYGGSEPVITPGTAFREKPVSQIGETAVAGVMIHRANTSTAERATVTRSFGVRVHRGIAASATAEGADGVRLIHAVGRPGT